MTIKIWGTESIVRSTGDAAVLSSITSLGNGGYVSTWWENGKLYFQLYNGLGEKVGSVTDMHAGSIVAATVPHVQSVGTEGSFVVTWTTETGTTTKTHTREMRTFDFEGIQQGTLSQGPSSTLEHGAKLGSGEAGGYSTVFVDDTNATPFVKFRAYSANGDETASIDVARGFTPSVSYIGNHKYAVAYQSPGNGPFKTSIVDTSGAIPTVTTSSATFTPVAVDDVVALKSSDGTLSGKFVVIAEKNGTSIDAYTFNEDGSFANPTTPSVEIGGTFQNSLATNYASATSLSHGGYAAVYVANNGNGDFGDVFVRVVDKDGNVEAPLLVNLNSAAANNGSQDTPSISEMADGRLAITWGDPTLGKALVATTIIDARTAAVIVHGTSHDDIYVGSDFDGDVLDGAGGNDLLIGGLGGDVLKGGAGIDTASFQYATTGVVASLIAGGTGGEAAGDTYEDIENLRGSNHNDYLAGNAGINLIDGGAGSDTVSYAGQAANITINLTTGTASDGDTLVSIENAVGTSGNDTLIGNAGINALDGGAGDDTYIVQNTGDVVVEVAGGGVDTVTTSVSYALSAFVEKLIAIGSLAVSLTGNDLGNTITGNDADNVINGGTGADTMMGGAGNDIYYVDNIGDVIVDTAGNDTVVVSGSVSIKNFTGIENVILSTTGGVSVDGSDFANTLNGNDAANVLNGFGGDDILMGLGGNDQLNGGDGNDLLKGGDGIDILRGEGGNDTIYGGAGKDTLYGGTGKDVFAFDTKLSKKTNLDKIADYNVKDDTIWLDNAVFTKIGRGAPEGPRKLSAAFFKVGTKAADKNDYIVYNKAKGVLYYDSDGSGSKAMVEIATLNKNLKMTAADFFVI